MNTIFKFFLEHWLIILLFLVFLPILISQWVRDFMEIQRSRKELKDMEKRLEESDKRMMDLTKLIIKNKESLDDGIKKANQILEESSKYDGKSGQ